MTYLGYGLFTSLQRTDIRLVWLFGRCERSNASADIYDSVVCFPLYRKNIMFCMPWCVGGLKCYPEGEGNVPPVELVMANAQYFRVHVSLHPTLSSSVSSTFVHPRLLRLHIELSSITFWLLYVFGGCQFLSLFSLPPRSMCLHGESLVT